MTRFSVSTLIPLLFISGVSGKLIQAAAGDDVTFPLTEECMKGRGTLKRRLQDNSLHSVGDLDSSWKPAPGYISRFFQSSDSVILTSADISDEGYYEFDCNNKKEESAQLQVFIPSDVFVREGEDTILPCRSITAGQWVKSVRWRRDGEVVLDVRSGKTTYGNGFDESRVSIPSDWDQRAKLSLIIKRTEARDGGVYYCDIDKVEKHRSAVRLHVSTPPSTTSQPTTTERVRTQTALVLDFTVNIKGLLRYISNHTDNRAQLNKKCILMIGGGLYGSHGL